MKLEKEVKFAVTSGLRAEISLRNGGLHVIGNDEQESIVKVEMDCVKNLPEGDDLSEYITIEYDEESNILSLQQTEKKLPSLLKSLKVTLSVPAASEISGRSINGGIKTENIVSDQEFVLTNGGVKSVACSGRLEVHSTNGGIKVLDHEGELVLEQKNGGIGVMDSKGKINLVNKNGGVKLNHCQGELTLEHKNGAIKVMNAGFTKADIQTVNSSIYYEFEEIEAGDFNFINSHGKISLIIPKELEYNIRAKTKRGKVMIGLDKSYEQRGDGEKEFTIVNGSGSVNIDIESQLGSILLMDELHIHADVEGKISRKVEAILKDKIIPTLESLTHENAPKIQKQINKMGERLSRINIDIPEIEGKIKDVINSISDTINVNLAENSEDIEKYKDAAINKVNMTMENISEFVAKKKSDVESELGKQAGNLKKDKAEEVMERSKLKILELLEQGKINPQEAERLLKALSSSRE
jgi:SHOCT-like domain